MARVATSVRFLYIFAGSETLSVRFFMAVSNFECAGVLLAAYLTGSYYPPLVPMSSVMPIPVTALLFFISGMSMVYGLASCRYSWAQLITEPGVSFCLWVFVTTCSMHSGGYPDLTLVPTLASCWLLARYPHKLSSSRHGN